MKERIRIAGAGISGLTAAVILAQNGQKVQVFEAGPHPGARFKGDWQHLDNWTSEIDVLERLRNLGLEINFSTEPCYKMSIYSPSFRRIILESRRPLFYSVKRGRPEESIDNGFFSQAKRLGVEVYFRKPMEDKEVDIVATGPKKADGYIAGLNFASQQEDIILVLIDKDISQLYSYCSIIEGKGTIAASAHSPKKAKENLIELQRKIKEILGIVVEDGEFFIAKNKPFIGEFLCLQRGSVLYLGEAAGIQDYFAGFSIMPAVESAYLAAKSIIENLDYEELCKKEILPQTRTSFVNSFIAKLTPDFLLDYLVPITAKMGKDFREVLGRLYNGTMLHRLFFPFLWQTKRIIN